VKWTVTLRAQNRIIRRLTYISGPIFRCITENMVYIEGRIIAFQHTIPDQFSTLHKSKLALQTLHLCEGT